MARTDTLEHYLTDIADAIRAKTGETGPISASSFDTSIGGIPSGGSGYTGHVDEVGLLAAGWTQSEINDFKENGISWDSDVDTLYQLDADDIAGTKPTQAKKYWDSTVGVRTGNYNNWYNIIAIPSSKSTSTAFKFSNCHNLRYMPKKDLTNATGLASTFYNCYNLRSIGGFENSSTITNTNQMFNNCYNIQEVPLFDTQNVTDMSKMFNYCHSLKTIPTFNTGKVTNMNNMFAECVSLETIPLINTSKVTNMSGMFYGCRALKSIPVFDTSSATNMSSMFYYCDSLEAVSLSDTSKVTNMNSMFYGCYALQSIAAMDTSGVTDMGSMFYDCRCLTTLPILDCSASVNLVYIFSNIGNLVNCGGFKDLGEAYLTTASANYSNYTLNISSTTLLTHDSLMNIINNLYDIASKGCNTQKVTIGATNLAKLSADEIAIATAKGWTVS